MNPLKRVLRRTRLLDDPFEDAVALAVSRTRDPVVLDVGCGNHSPAKFKEQFPGVRYVGIDIAEYNLDDADRSAADELIILDCPPEQFTDRLAEAIVGRRFDAIILRHVVEHCVEPARTVSVLATALSRPGTFYLTFPCEASVNFPHGRNSTLNFYDDPTHRWVPVVSELEAGLPAGCEVTKLVLRARGGALVGAVCWLVAMPGLTFARLTGRAVRVSGVTWRALGFETVMVVSNLVDAGERR